MNTVHGDFHSRPGNYDVIDSTTTTFDHDYYGFLVVSDLTYTAIAQQDQTLTGLTETLDAGTTILVKFSSITISSGKIYAYWG